MEFTIHCKMSTIVLSLCVIFAIVLVKLYKLYAAKCAFLKKIESIPGPKSLPIVGNGLEFQNIVEVLPVLMKYTKEFGPTYKLQLGLDTHVFTSDPKLIECVTTSTTQVTKSVSYRFLDNWLGTGLLTATNPKWKAQRRLLTPTFHFKILEECVPIFHSNAQNLVRHWQTSLGSDIDIYQDVVLCSLDIICETSMGFSINALKEGNSSDYVHSVKYMGKMVVDRTFSIWRQFDFLYKLSPDYKKERKCVDYLHSVTDKVIQTKRQELHKQKLKFGTESTDDLYGQKRKVAFLDMLLKCSNEEGGTLSDYDIRQEVDTFMFAGHDTVASGISFTLYLLAKHQDVQQKVYQEMKEVFGNGVSEDDTVTMDKLNDLKYLETVLKESMRLYPPVPMIARELTDDTTYNGILYPKGMTIIVLQYATHRNPEFYENPDDFLPERFLFENSIKRSSFAYIPFSAGPRNCLGQKFAMLEMKSVVSALVKEYKFSGTSDFEMIPVAETVLKSLNGVYIHLEKR